MEGLKRNIHNLKHFLDKYVPDLIFLSEPQIFQCDLDDIMEYFRGQYMYYLNSADRHDDEIPLTLSRAHGGTLVMWKVDLDPYIEVFPVDNASFLPIILSPPGFIQSVHISIYLPTSGKDQQFVNEVSALSCSLEKIHHRLQHAPTYLRGDFNVNGKNVKRLNLFNHFIEVENFREVSIPHPTYHHFVGAGASDSNLDKILYSMNAYPEEVYQILCSNDDPLIDSHHDIILSCVNIPSSDSCLSDKCTTFAAPRLTNNLHNIHWSDSGIEAYQKLVAPHLQRLQKVSLHSSSKTCVELLLASTNSLLTDCAKISNK